jgi:predicted phage terminase large subunit-like protein
MSSGVELVNQIIFEIKHNPHEYQNYEDLFGLVYDAPGDNVNLLKWIASMLNQELQVCDVDYAEQFDDLLKRVFTKVAPYDFDSYMIALEWNREPQDRFYLPRRKTLKPLADAIQDLAEDRLDELFLSMPPRVGKTSLLMFAITWLVGRNPEASNLYSAYSDYITNAFYTGCLEIIGDKVTYRWNDIFPGKVIADTNAKEEYFNIDRKKRYASMTARSLYGTLNGATDCNGFLIADDLIGSIEEAMNKDRLVNVWAKVDNNLLPRAKQTAKILWCGTRWSLADPIGLRRELVTNSEKFENHRVRIITLPALNDKGESNFNYDYNVGFDTNYYEARRASFEHNNDLASWEAQYMQEPIERSGSLFEPGEMLYFNGELPPDDMLVRKFMAVDPAFGGGDYTAAPVVFQYTDGACYIVDCVYSNEEKSRTQAMIVDAIQKYGVTAVRFECNKMTMSYKEEVEAALRNKGLKINLMTKAAPNNQAKEARIMDKAGTIRGFYFLEDKKRSKTYQAFILNTFSFKIVGGNKHDDAPDSLAMAADFIERPVSSRVEFMKRPW